MDKNGLKIRYSDLWGTHKKKFDFLEKHDLKNTKWREIAPKEPNYFFVPRDTKGEEKYQRFTSLKDIFEKFIIGVATGKDNVLVDFKKDALKRKLSFHSKDIFDVSMQNYDIKKDLADSWFKELAKSDIEKQIVHYSYRPFDKRYVIYNKKILQRARESVMKNMLFPNLALTCMNAIKKENVNYFFAVDGVVDRHILDLSADSAYMFPLFIYNKQSEEQETIFNGQERLDLKGVQHTIRTKDGKEPNIKLEIFAMLEKLFGKKVSPEEIFNYIYAILYSNKYRQKYNEFLKIDFPRIPFTSDYLLFKKISKIGEELVALHLLKSKFLEKTGAKFKGAGLNEVKKREYNEKEKRLYINDSQYFEGIEKEVWNYHIGGYQVLDKWIKDRVGKSLGREDIEHYLKVVEVLGKTIGIQKEIDKYYPKVERKIK